MEFETEPQRRGASTFKASHLHHSVTFRVIYKYIVNVYAYAYFIKSPKMTLLQLQMCVSFRGVCATVSIQFKICMH